MHTHRALDGQVAILKPAGRFVAGTDTEDFVNTARQLVASGNQNLLVNLGDVTFMDSLGAGIFPQLLIMYSNVKGAVKICNLNSRVRTLFDVVRFHYLFEYFDSESAALEAFARERGLELV